MFRNDSALMNYPAIYSDIAEGHFQLSLFCVTSVIYSQETEALPKERILCPGCINSPFLGTL